jgi:hypothetical protein
VKTTTSLTHRAKRRTVAATFAMASLLLLCVPAAQAAKGGGKPTSGGASLSVVMVADANANGLPNYGDTIRFNVSVPESAMPSVSVQCSKNGTVVYGSVTGYYSSYPWPWTQNMTLSSASWTAGAADCIATLSSSAGSGTLRFSAAA